MSRKLLLIVVAAMLIMVGAIAPQVVRLPGAAAQTPGPEPAAINAYLTLAGEAQGRIEGGVTRRGEEGSIGILDWQHELSVPTGPSGLPTGRRQHKPLVITKPIDKSTPLLMQALVNNENIVEWELRLWRPDPAGAGTEQQYFTIQLENARIVSVRHETGDAGGHDVREHVSFTYQKIIWTWEDGGITSEDTWSSPGR